MKTQCVCSGKCDPCPVKVVMVGTLSGDTVPVGVAVEVRYVVVEKQWMSVGVIIMCGVV